MANKHTSVRRLIARLAGLSGATRPVAAGPFISLPPYQNSNPLIPYLLFWGALLPSSPRHMSAHQETRLFANPHQCTVGGCHEHNDSC